MIILTVTLKASIYVFLLHYFFTYVLYHLIFSPLRVTDLMEDLISKGALSPYLISPFGACKTSTYFLPNWKHMAF